MHGVSRWFLTVFVSPIGIVVLAALDSTLFFSMPFGIDGAVIFLAARLGSRAWIVPLLATLGSVAGAALTFWMGGKIGDKGLPRYVSPRRLERIRRRIRSSGAITLAVLDLVPPPFPFTLFVLAAGALDVSVRTFFLTLAACRILRFGLETALAARYGRSIVSIFESDRFNDIVVGCVLLAVALTAWSAFALLRSTRTSGRQAGLRAQA